MEVSVCFFQQRVQRDPVKLHIRKCQTPLPNPKQDPDVVYRVMSVQVLFYYSRDTISSRAIYWWFANVVSIMQKIEPLRIPVNYGWVSLCLVLEEGNKKYRQYYQTKRRKFQPTLDSIVSQRSRLRVPQAMNHSLLAIFPSFQ